jgi:hypothetical protein
LIFRGGVNEFEKGLMRAEGFVWVEFTHSIENISAPEEGRENPDDADGLGKFEVVGMPEAADVVFGGGHVRFLRGYKQGFDSLVQPPK